MEVVVDIVYPENSLWFSPLDVPIGSASTERATPAGTNSADNNGGYSLRWTIPELPGLAYAEVEASANVWDSDTTMTPSELTVDVSLDPIEFFGEVTTSSFEDDARKGNNTDRVWVAVSSSSTKSSYRVKPAYLIDSVSVDEPDPAPGDIVNFTITVRVGSNIDKEVAIELTGGLAVDEDSTASPPREIIYDYLVSSAPEPSYSNGVITIGTRKFTKRIFQMSATLPVRVASDAVVNEQCLTATVTGKPPPGAGPYDDDISDNVAQLCLGEGPVEPLLSGQVDAFTVYPCVGITDAPCDSADDIRVRAVHPVSGDPLTSGAAVFRLDPLLARKYDAKTTHSVNDGNTVSWQTSITPGTDYTNSLTRGVQLYYSRAPFAGHTSAWSLTLGISARNADGNVPPPGKVFLRSTRTGNETRKAESPSYEEVPIAPSGRATSSTKTHFFLEFEKLGTYQVTWHAIAKRLPGLHGSENCNPDGNGVNQIFCASETYTFQVGPMADLEVEDGGASPHVAAGRYALTILPVNNGPDDAGRARVTGLPTGAEVMHISQGSYDGATGVWNVGELKVRGWYRSQGQPDPALILSAAEGDTANVSIANLERYEVCIGPKSNPVNLPHTTEAACEAVTNASWNSTPVYDHDAGNNSAVIVARPGTGEDAPSAMRVNGVQATRVSWEGMGRLYGLAVTHYEIERSTDGGRNWTVASDQWTLTTYFDVGVSPNSSLRYRVRAVNEAGVAGPWSAWFAAGSLAGLAGPRVNVSARRSEDNPAGAIVVSWGTPLDDGGSPVTGYQAQASSTGTSGWSNACSTTGGAERSCEHAGLAVGTTHYYRVAARNAHGLGPWSDPPAVGSTRPGVPSAPRSLRAQAISAGDGRVIRLTWTEPANDYGSPVSGYEVQMSSDGSAWGDLSVASGTEYTDDAGLEPGETRHYRVRAVNQAGGGQWSNTARATTFAVPPARMALHVEASGENAIEITWGDASDPGTLAQITGYELQVCVPPRDCPARNDGDYSRLASPAGTARSYTHGGLRPGDERYYRLRARNSAGWGQWSEPVRAATLDLDLEPGQGLPGAPRLTARANGASEIWLSWTEPSTRGLAIDLYEMQISDDGQGWTFFSDFLPEDREIVHAWLEGGTRHYYRIRALVSVGGRDVSGPWSNVVNATTPAGAPPEPLSLSGEGYPHASDETQHGYVELKLLVRADAAITGYRVERNIYGGGDLAWQQVSVSKTGTTSDDCEIEGTATRCETVTLRDNTSSLYPATLYYYRAAAVNRNGWGPYAYADVYTGGDQIWSPSHPRLLSLSGVSQTAATVAWLEPDDDGGMALTGYEYQFHRVCGPGETEDCGEWPVDADGLEVVKKTTGKSARLSSLESGGEYLFRVRAVNRAEELVGKGDWSDELRFDLPDS